MGKDIRATKGARYEYRVWGRHKRARKLLAKLADETITETVEDCYFLAEDDHDPEVNVKVRSDTLKVKRLIGRSRGFEAWVTHRHRHGKDVPAPFDDLAEELRLHKAGRKNFDLQRQVERLDDDHPTTAVFVTKNRTRYRIGNIKAEVTDITIDETGEVVRTVAIEGTDLDALVALRKKLGLNGEDNVAVHTAIDDVL